MYDYMLARTNKVPMNVENSWRSRELFTLYPWEPICGSDDHGGWADGRARVLTKLVIIFFIVSRTLENYLSATRKNRNRSAFFRETFFNAPLRRNGLDDLWKHEIKKKPIIRISLEKACIWRLVRHVDLPLELT